MPDTEHDLNTRWHRITWPKHKLDTITWPKDKMDTITWPKDKMDTITWPKDKMDTITWPKDKMDTITWPKDKMDTITWPGRLLPSWLLRASSRTRRWWSWFYDRMYRTGCSPSCPSPVPETQQNPLEPTYNTDQNPLEPTSTKKHHTDIILDTLTHLDTFRHKLQLHTHRQTTHRHDKLQHTDQNYNTDIIKYNST